MKNHELEENRMISTPNSAIRHNKIKFKYFNSSCRNFCLFISFLNKLKFTRNMLNRKKCSRKRAPERCFCNECNGIYIDPRTYRKHNTTFSLQIDDLMIEASQFFLEDILIIEASQDDPMIEASQSSLLQNEDISQLENSTMLQSRMRKRNRNYTIREYDEDSTSFDDNVDNNVDNNDDDNNDDDNND